MPCLISVGSLLNCDALPVGGVSNFVLLYNYSEWRTMVDTGKVTVVAEIVTDIDNSVGVKAYRFDVPDETALVLGSPNRIVAGGIDGFDHTVNFSILGTKHAQKSILRAINFEKCVAVVYKKNGTGEIYGSEQGLKLTTNTYAPNSPVTGSVIPVQLITSPDTAPENNMPPDIFITDVATTKALILGLTVVGV